MMLQLQNYKQLEADAETKRRCTIQGKSPVCIRNQLYKIIYGRQAQMVTGFLMHQSGKHFSSYNILPQ